MILSTVFLVFLLLNSSKCDDCIKDEDPNDFILENEAEDPNEFKLINDAEKSLEEGRRELMEDDIEDEPCVSSENNIAQPDSSTFCKNKYIWDRIHRLRENYLRLDKTLQNLLELARRNSILLYGVSDTGQERFEDTFFKVKQIFLNYFNFEVEYQYFDRLARLGTSYGDENTPREQPRPIFIRFACMYYRNMIIQNAKNLKGTPYVVHPWLSPRKAAQKSELLKIMRKINAAYPGAAKLRDYRRLWVKGILYSRKELRSIMENGGFYFPESKAKKTHDYSWDHDTSLNTSQQNWQ